MCPGSTPKEELIHIYQKADIAINPSIIYESVSYTCLEAMACGKPVIASKIGGIPEVVIDGETGLLFEPGSVRDLISSLKILLNDPLRREEMGKAGRKRAEEFFDVLKVAPKNIEIYKSLIAKQ